MKTHYSGIYPQIDLKQEPKTRKVLYLFTPLFQIIFELMEYSKQLL